MHIINKTNNYNITNDFSKKNIVINYNLNKANDLDKNNLINYNLNKENDLDKNIVINYNLNKTNKSINNNLQINKWKKNISVIENTNNVPCIKQKKKYPFYVLKSKDAICNISDSILNNEYYSEKKSKFKKIKNHIYMMIFLLNIFKI